jgi:hypothetical protein
MVFVISLPKKSHMHRPRTHIYVYLGATLSFFFFFFKKAVFGGTECEDCANKLILKNKFS